MERKEEQLCAAKVSRQRLGLFTWQQAQALVCHIRTDQSILENVKCILEINLENKAFLPTYKPGKKIPLVVGEH